MSEGKILVADDTRVIRTVMARKLGDQGYSVTAVASGMEAMEEIARTPYDLVVLDIHMPDLNGFQALESIRKEHTAIELPVIMATAKDEDEEVVRCFEAGANDFVSKPINFPILFARLDTHLRLKRAMERLARESGD